MWVVLVQSGKPIHLHTAELTPNFCLTQLEGIDRAAAVSSTATCDTSFLLSTSFLRENKERTAENRSGLAASPGCGVRSLSLPLFLPHGLLSIPDARCKWASAGEETRMDRSLGNRAQLHTHSPSEANNAERSGALRTRVTPPHPTSHHISNELARMVTELQLFLQQTQMGRNISPFRPTAACHYSALSLSLCFAT